MIDRDYLFLLLRSLRGPLIASAKGRAQQNISQTVLKRWPIWLPPIEEQRRIATKVDELMALVDQLEHNFYAAEARRRDLAESVCHQAVERPTLRPR